MVNQIRSRMFLSGCDFSLKLLTVLLFQLATIVTSDEEQQPKLVQILFRHGDRSPTRTYPTDPWKDAWPDGFGQLTTVGMQQQFEMGKYLKTRYGKLVNDTYNQATVYVRSTDVDRTLMSAYSNLAGFFPPQGRHIWNNDLLWQPIPVHTLPVQQDYMLSFDAICPRYDTLYRQEMRSPEANKINDQYREVYKYLANHTGMTINDFDQAAEIYDILFVDQIHNMTLPNWVNKDLMAELKLIALTKTIFRVKTFIQRKLLGGTLVKELVKNMQTTVDKKPDKHKIYINSAHDVTVVSLLAALDVFDPHAPPYCSVVMLELLEINNTHYVKILYRNDTTRDPYELRLKGCDSPCPFDLFKKLTASIIPNDIKAECSIQEDNIALISAIAGSILGCALLMLIVSAYAFYKRNNDTYRYLNIQNDI